MPSETGYLEMFLERLLKRGELISALHQLILSHPTRRVTYTVPSRYLTASDRQFLTKHMIEKEGLCLSWSEAVKGEFLLHVKPLETP